MLCSSARGRRRARSVTGVHGDELRMVRGVTVQHPAQIIGGQRRFVARKISASDLCAAATAQLRRGVPRLAGRFDLQWGVAQAWGAAQAWIAEGGRLRASSSCLLSLCWCSHFESSQVRRALCTTGLLTVGSDASESGSVAFSFGQGDMTRWQRLDGALRRCSFFTLLLFVGLQVTVGRCCH